MNEAIKTGIKISKIKSVMAEQGVTQEKLAEILNISFQSVNRKLQGKSQFKANELGIMARHFGVEVAYFFS